MNNNINFANFIPPKEHKKFIIWLSLSISSLVILLSVLTVAYIRKKTETSSINTQEIDIIKNKITKLKDKIKNFEVANNKKIDSYLYLNFIENLIPNSICLTQLEIEQNKNCKIEGVCKTNSIDIIEFMNSLEKTKYFKNIFLASIKEKNKFLHFLIKFKIS